MEKNTSESVNDDDFYNRYSCYNKSFVTTIKYMPVVVPKWTSDKFWNKSSDELLEYFYTLTESDKINFIKFVIGRKRLELFIKILQSGNIDLEYDDNLFLKYAAEHRSYDILIYLIDNGANVAAENNFIIKNLFLDMDFPFIKTLIDHGADIKSVFDLLPRLCLSNIKSVFDMLPRSYQFEKIKYLIDSGADIHQNNDQSLLGAIAYANNDIAIYLIENGANIHADNDYALRYSVRTKNIKMIEYLLKAGADVTKISPADIIDCLHNNSNIKFIFSNKHVCDILQLLISYGMDISFLNRIDFSGLNSNNIVKLLTSNGIESDAVANLMALVLLDRDVYKKFIK